MKQSNLAHDIRDRFKKLQSLIKKLDGHFAEADVHDFRVEVKKLRALLRLVNAGAISPHSLSAQLHSFYLLAGHIRNEQLQHRNLLLFAEQHQQCVPASCTEFLGHRLTAAIEPAQQFLDKNPIPGNMTARFPKTISTKTAEKFIHHRLQLFQFLASDSLHYDEKLHDLRKSLKDLLYAWPYLTTEARRQIKGTSVRSKRSIDALATLLGDYRDVCLSLDIFRDEKFLLNTGEDAKPFLQMVSEGWLQEKKNLLERINYALFPEVVPKPVTLIRHIHAHRVAAELPVTNALPNAPENPISPANFSFESYELHID